MNNIKKCPALASKLGKSKRHAHSNTSAAQRQRLLQALMREPVSTIKARHELDIMMPAARIFELRHKHGHEIVTHWIEALNPNGGKHRIAQYALIPKKESTQ